MTNQQLYQDRISRATKHVLRVPVDHGMLGVPVARDDASNIVGFGSDYVAHEPDAFGVCLIVKTTA